mmetsp:Transcript_58430/g.165923  ORF Transcript_58430/g.165923 Transcript_58430/m.165923 type:complete len:472 (-) Transcript_58430:410-1825(-)
MPRSRQDAAPVWGQAASARDALLPFFGQSQFAQDILERIQVDGYVVLPGILSREEADVELDRMWGFVETVSPTVSRSRPETWRRSGGQGPDPWPHAQRDMFQLHQAGWAFGDLREKAADRVFQGLYGTRELHVSKDGFTFFRPTKAQVKTSPNDHFDQGLSAVGLHCVQGSVALTDQEENDGCFLCWPGSHYHRESILASLGRSKSHRDFIMLTEAEKHLLRSYGLSPRRVPVRKGDVILWRSDLCHCGAPPIGARPGFRAVVYICCLPAALTPESVYAEKLRAYQLLETGSHWPSREEWFETRDKHEALAIRPYFRSPPVLPTRLQELYGLVRYELAAPIAPSDVEWEKKAPARRRWGKARKPGVDGETGTQPIQDPRAHEQLPQVGDDLLPCIVGPAECEAATCQEDAPGTGEAEKEARKLRKALSEIEQLESKRQAGEQLRMNQLTKLEKQNEYRQQLALVSCASSSS